MDSINMPTWLTPSFVATGLTILSIVAILIGFLMGFIRGTYRASYRFIVSIVVILGLWSCRYSQTNCYHLIYTNLI